jgi:CDP-6-deoxy-D-xylo-4-hexulose-3-dehydrase
MQAAIGVAQLDRVSGFIAARRENFARLHAGLSGCTEFLVMPEATPNSEPSWFGFPITVRPGAPFTRAALVAHLNEARIATRYLFGGNLIHQPYMQGRKFRVAGETPNADLVMTSTFWIGVYPALGTAQIDYMIDRISEFCAGI